MLTRGLVELLCVYLPCFMGRGFRVTFRNKHIQWKFLQCLHFFAGCYYSLIIYHL